MEMGWEDEEGKYRKKKERMAEQIRKERKDKRRSYGGGFGGKRKGSHMGETAIYVYLKTVEYQPLILEYSVYVLKT